MKVDLQNVLNLIPILVYIGGMAGFFLGCSLLNFTEFIYYFTWNFVRVLREK